MDFEKPNLNETMAGNENEWQLSMTSLNERLGYIYNQKVLTDIKIIVGPKGNENQESFHAHKFILILGSPIFEEMLRYLSDENEDQIFLPDISPRAFHKVLKYLYTDEIRETDEIKVMDICKAADKLKIPFLKNKFKSYFEKPTLTPDNVCKILEASDLKNRRLKNKCLQFIEDNTENVITSDGFKTAEMETVKLILELNRVSLASEAPLIEAVVEWGKNQYSYLNSSISLRGIIESLTPYLKFSSMSTEELAKIIENHKGIFSEKLAISFFTNIALQLDPKVSIAKCGTRIYQSKKAQNENLFWKTSFPPMTQVYSFPLNYEKTITPRLWNHSSSIFMKCNRETVLIRGIRLCLKAEKKILPNCYYTVSVSFDPLSTRKIVRKGNVYKMDDLLIIFAKPLEWIRKPDINEIEIRVDISLYSYLSTSLPVLISKETSKGLTYECLSFNDIMNSWIILPFSYRLKSSYGNSFIISDLYYSVR